MGNCCGSEENDKDGPDAVSSCFEIGAMLVTK